MIGTAASPYRPIPYVVSQKIRMDATNAPAIANTGGHRTTSQSSGGSTTIAGLKENQSLGWCMTYNRANDSRASTPTPSINSLRVGGSRHSWSSPITSGAAITIPTPSDRNHVRQTSQNGAAA